MENIEAAIFDLDGTLLETMHIWHRVPLEYLKKKGITGDLSDVFNEKLRTKSLEQCAEIFKDEFKIEDSIEDILLEVHDVAKEYYVEEVKIKDNVIDLLEKFKKNKIKMCIATANSKDIIKEFLAKSNLESYFEFVYTCSEFQTTKETPVIFEKSLAKLDSNPANTFVFEDSLHAIKSAKSLGLKIVGVYDDSSKDQIQEIKAVSDIYINGFKELL